MVDITLELPEGKKVFFASDFHLGAKSHESSKSRERRINRWLDKIYPDAAALFLAGDVFDFWFEYRHVAPKGYVRFLAKLAQFTDNGIPVIMFHGNHDMWMKQYLKDEIDVTIYPDLVTLSIGQKKILVGHGDGYGPGDFTYKILKRVFRNKLAQWLFGWLHPTIAFGIATGWSSHSRITSDSQDEGYKGESEWLYQFCQEKESQEHHDFYIFGHRHLPIDDQVNDNSRYINLGEWVTYNSFATFDGNDIQLEYFEK